MALEKKLTPGLGQGKRKLNLEHLIIPESKEVRPKNDISIPQRHRTQTKGASTS